MSRTPILYTAVFRDPDAEDDDAGVAVGELMLDADSRWSVSASDPQATEFLAKVATDLNEREVVTLKVPGQERYALESVEVERTAADYPAAARAYLRRFYALELNAAAELAAVGESLS
jgi:hypothetical protein